MARPSIVPIALTVDDRTGYTLWAPPWEEDGEEWQAFLGTTEDGPGSSGVAKVHLFPTPAALAAFCRTSTDHDLADHPVWPVVAGLGAADLTPDDDHRYDLDGVYDIAADNPDRWTVEELAATLDIVGRLADCLDTDDSEDDDAEDDDAEDSDAEDSDHSEAGEDSDDDGDQFEAVADLLSRPEVASLALGIEAFAGRSGEDAWVRIGAALDELWEDVVEELGEHLDWTGAGSATLGDYPSASAATDDEDVEDVEGLGDDEDVEVEDLGDDEDDLDVETLAGDDGAAATGATASSTASLASPAAPGSPGVSTIRGGSRITAGPEAVAKAGEFWEAVGILPVEIIVREGAGLTLRCYVEDEARFLGQDGEIYVFETPLELARYCSETKEDHDLVEIASWPEVADTDTPPLPADQDRYDLMALAEVLREVADGAGGLVTHEALVQPVEGVRDIAEYAGLAQVEELLAPSSPLGRALAIADREPGRTLREADAAALQPEWDRVVTAVSGALTFRT